MQHCTSLRKHSLGLSSLACQNLQVASGTPITHSTCMYPAGMFFVCQYKKRYSAFPIEAWHTRQVLRADLDSSNPDMPSIVFCSLRFWPEQLGFLGQPPHRRLLCQQCFVEPPSLRALCPKCLHWLGNQCRCGHPVPDHPVHLRPLQRAAQHCRPQQPGIHRKREEGTLLESWAAPI